MAKHEDWITEVMSDEQYNKEYKAAVVVHPRNKDLTITFPDKYKEEYDSIAHHMMQDEDSTLTRVCVALKVSKPTLLKWMKRHPSFRDAIETGRLIGEEAFRAKIKQHMYEPTSNVNNGLIKMMASNIHNINDTPAIVINNNQDQKQAVAIGQESSTLYQDAIGRAPEENDEYGEE